MHNKTILFLLLIPFCLHSQAKDKLVNHTIPPLIKSDVKLMCDDIAIRSKVSGTAMDTAEYYYEKRLWEMAGAKMGIDDDEAAKKKIQLWWNKYKTKCGCSSIEFGIVKGNILKYAVNQNMPNVIETFVINYELDINFVDPADNRNLLDFVNDELKKLITGAFSESSIKLYEKYRETIIGLGGKPSK